MRAAKLGPSPPPKKKLGQCEVVLCVTVYGPFAGSCENVPEILRFQKVR